MNIKKVVIPAAGFGTRFLPITKSIPKEMLPILNKPAIEYIVQEAMLSGINDFYIVISKGKEAIADYFKHSTKLDGIAHKNKLSLSDLESIINFANFSYVHQEKQLGLGHAILMAKNHIKDDFFAVMLPDDLIVSNRPSIKQLLDLAQVENASVIAVQEVPNEFVSSYGVISIKNKLSNNMFELDGLVEKPAAKLAPSNLAIIGRYVLSSNIFSSLEQINPGANGEIQLTDAIGHLLETGQKVFAYKVEGTRYDVGTPIGWLKANNEISYTSQT